MSDVLALDIETSNYSYEIGGWDKTHLFKTTVVATHDGHDSTVFCNEDIDVDATVEALHPRILGDHILNHVEAGGALVGHNILRFDLPVLRDSLDCFAAGEILRSHRDNILDTSQHLRKSTGLIGDSFFVTLDDVCKHTLGQGKGAMKSIDAPKAWNNGHHSEVAKYCLEDTRLNWGLWQHGVEEGVVKSRSRWTGDIVDLEVDWEWEKGETPLHKRHSS
mgnify:CR=1 FL=1